MALVNGVTTNPNQYGEVNGGGKLAGTSSNDVLQGTAAFNQYYGGAGNDTFVINAKYAVASGAHEGQSSAYADQFAYITDFGGASEWNATNNDFIRLVGFGTGAHIDLVQSADNASAAAPSAKMYWYTVTDSAGQVYNFTVNSLNGKALGAGDFNFY